MAKLLSLATPTVDVQILNDFIVDDCIPGKSFNNLPGTHDYQTDVCMINRNCPDPSSNSFGLKLIQLCIESGLRILNGRHKDNFSNDFTYCGPNGYSVIDYIITLPEVFDFIRKFIVCSFNMYSDHAPLHFEMRLNIQTENVSQNVHVEGKHDTYRWNSNYRDESVNVIAENVHIFEDLLSSHDLDNTDDIESCVSQFIEQMNTMMSKFHKLERKPNGKGLQSNHSHRSKPKDDFDKPWFDERCRNLYQRYRNALNMFNQRKISGKPS